MSSVLTQATFASSLLQGKTALITGASRGIGRAVALTFARSGARLFLLGRNGVALDLVKCEVEKSGHPCATLCLDLSCSEESVAKAIGHFGPIDVLINNAGVFHTTPMAMCPDNVWEETMAVNLRAAVILANTLLPAMKDQGWGRIVNVASVSGKNAEAFGGAYSASKFALVEVTQQLALAVAKYGVTVNAISPGWVLTDMALTLLEDEQWCALNKFELTEAQELARLSTPQERFIPAEEIADLALFLCSAAAQGITGQNINICGGLSLTAAC